jgi:putative flippase GtrA
MISKIKEVSKSPLLIQLLKFGLIGIIGVSFNYSIFFILYHFFKIHYTFSSATGFALGILLVFFLNKNFTFKIKNNEETKKMIIKYYILNISLALLSLLILSIFVEFLHINVYIANIISLGMIAILHFIGSKFGVFIRKDGKEKI